MHCHLATFLEIWVRYLATLFMNLLTHMNVAKCKVCGTLDARRAYVRRMLYFGERKKLNNLKSHSIYHKLIGSCYIITFRPVVKWSLRVSELHAPWQNYIEKE